MGDDADHSKTLSQQTPPLQMASRIIAMTSRELFEMIAHWHTAHPGSIAELSPGEADPLDEQEAERAEEADQPPWFFLDQAPLPAIDPVADVWVFGDPPQARANRGAIPRIKAVFDAEGGMTQSVADVSAASWLVRALRMRAKTYERAVAAILQLRPQLAIATEPAAVEPVNTLDVAEAIGVAASTVARLCAACRYQTIHGVVELVESSGKISARSV